MSRGTQSTQYAAPGNEFGCGNRTHETGGAVRREAYSVASKFYLTTHNLLRLRLGSAVVAVIAPGYNPSLANRDFCLTCHLQGHRRGRVITWKYNCYI